MGRPSEIDFYYDFGSPNVYLAWRALQRVEGLTIKLKPVLIGGLFKAANNQPPWQAFSDVPAKMKYLMAEIDRFVAMYELTEYRFNPHFPVNTLLPMRVAVVALEEKSHDQFFEPVIRAMWEKGLDISRTTVLATVLDDIGLEGERMVSRAQEQGIKDKLAELTQAASMRGIFGLPTWFHNGNGTDSDRDAQMFFGKDNCWMFGAQPKSLPI